MCSVIYYGATRVDAPSSVTEINRNVLKCCNHPPTVTTEAILCIPRLSGGFIHLMHPESRAVLMSIPVKHIVYCARSSRVPDCIGFTSSYYEPSMLVSENRLVLPGNTLIVKYYRLAVSSVFFSLTLSFFDFFSPVFLSVCLVSHSKFLSFLKHSSADSDAKRPDPTVSESSSAPAGTPAPTSSIAADAPASASAPASTGSPAEPSPSATATASPSVAAARSSTPTALLVGSPSSTVGGEGDEASGKVREQQQLKQRNEQAWHLHKVQTE